MEAISQQGVNQFRPAEETQDLSPLGKFKSGAKSILALHGRHMQLDGPAGFVAMSSQTAASHSVVTQVLEEQSQPQERAQQPPQEQERVPPQRQQHEQQQERAQQPPQEQEQQQSSQPQEQLQAQKQPQAQEQNKNDTNENLPAINVDGSNMNLDGSSASNDWHVHMDVQVGGRQAGFQAKRIQPPVIHGWDMHSDGAEGFHAMHARSAALNGWDMNSDGPEGFHAMRVQPAAPHCNNHNEKKSEHSDLLRPADEGSGDVDSRSHVLPGSDKSEGSRGAIDSKVDRMRMRKVIRQTAKGVRQLYKRHSRRMRQMLKVCEPMMSKQDTFAKKLLTTKKAKSVDAPPHGSAVSGDSDQKPDRSVQEGVLACDKSKTANRPSKSKDIKRNAKRLNLDQTDQRRSHHVITGYISFF